MANEFEFEKMQAKISSLESEIKSIKKYGLIWDKEKNIEINVTKCLNKVPLFKYWDDKKILLGEQNNILIEGDNFHALTSLNFILQESIDFIYIDPPYNTGQDDFVFNDKFVDEDDMFAHSKWLQFMSKRLNLAKKLLKPNGIMFISIDDHEQANLKLLCDSIFGEKNVETIIWNKEAEGNSGNLKHVKRFRDVHEYIICCYKNKYEIQFQKIHEAKIGKEDELNTANMAKTNANKTGDKSKIFEIVNPKNGKSWVDEWKYSKEQVDEFLSQNLVYFGKDGNNKPRRIIPMDDRRTFFQTSIIEKGSTSQGIKDLKEIFGFTPFSYPKPVALLKRLIEVAVPKNGVVLDFFAGSGTTAHAVLELNKEDPDSKRRFILCTNNEISASNCLKYLHDNKCLLDFKPDGNVKNKTIQNRIDDFFKSNQKIYRKLIVDKKDEYEKYGICQSITYPRIKTVITGIKPNKQKYEKGASPTNLLYFKINFVDNAAEEDQTKYNIAEKIDSLLCVSEQIYKPIHREHYFSHYSSFDGSKNLLIYNDIYVKTNFDAFREYANSINGDKVIYIFDLGSNLPEKCIELFPDCEIKEMPNKIYQIYKEMIESIKRSE